MSSTRFIKIGRAFLGIVTEIGMAVSIMALAWGLSWLIIRF